MKVGSTENLTATSNLDGGFPKFGGLYWGPPILGTYQMGSLMLMRLFRLRGHSAPRPLDHASANITIITICSVQYIDCDY